MPLLHARVGGDDPHGLGHLGGGRRTGNLPLGARAAARLSEARWWGTGTTVLVIVVVVLVRFWDGFVRMIG